MKWKFFFKTSCRTAINHTINTMIVNTTVMLVYVLLQHGIDAAYVPEEALGDVACTNIATHGVNYHCTRYKHEHD